MPQASTSFDANVLLTKLHNAENAGEISASAIENIRNWLTQPRYAEYAPQVAEHIQSQKWQTLAMSSGRSFHLEPVDAEKNVSDRFKCH